MCILGQDLMQNKSYMILYSFHDYYNKHTLFGQILIPIKTQKPMKRLQLSVFTLKYLKKTVLICYMTETSYTSTQKQLFLIICIFRYDLLLIA